MKNQIRAYRFRHKLTQSRLAKSIGTSQQLVQRIEAGVSRPSLEMASRICRALHATPCSIFPELGSACSGLPTLRTCGSADDESAVSAPAEWQVRITGAHDTAREFWVGEQEARRIQELLSHYNSATVEPRMRFLVFRTASKAVAANLSLIDWIRLEHSRERKFQGKLEPGNSDALHVFFKEGIDFRDFVFYVTDAQGDAVPTNFGHLMLTGQLPLFTVSTGPNETHVLNTERIALIEMPLDLLGAGEAAATSVSQSSVSKSLEQMPNAF